MGGFGASIQLLEDRCLTSVIEAEGGVLRWRRSRREILARVVDAIVNQPIWKHDKKEQKCL